MTVPVSGEDQPDPRVELLAEEISDGYRNWSWADSCRSFDPSRARWRRHATEIIHRLDEVDRATGIRRVTEASLKCPACECYYDANGVSCYRESHVDWVCTEMGDRS